jgi:transcriptional regulator with XRE-family HTH domain
LSDSKGFTQSFWPLASLLAEVVLDDPRRLARATERHHGDERQEHDGEGRGGLKRAAAGAGVRGRQHRFLRNVRRGFGEEVRRRREARGFTIEQLAERAGLTPNYVGTVETGKRDPSLSTVLGLANGLRAPSRAFRRRDGARPASVESGRLFEAAAPDVQDAVRRLLRALTRWLR